MPKWTTTGDLTTNNEPNYGGQGAQAYRPYNVPANYAPGIILALVSIDNQTYPDFQTVQPLPAGTTKGKIAGVVAADWPGFSGSINAGGVPTYVSSAQTSIRGTQFVNATIKGIAYAYVDQAGSGAVTIVDGLPIVSSRNTAGYGQGVAVATAVSGALVGVANLPASGIGSSLTAAALAQAAQVFTVATPAAGDVLNLIIQSPYLDTAPGTLQTATWSLALTPTTAASATTAAAAMVAYLNLQPNFSQYFTAANAAGAITVTVNALSTPFLVTFGATAANGTLGETGRFFTHISGMVANSLTTASNVTGAGGTTFVATGSTFTGGTGFTGKIPILVNGEF
jgi:hypothetical protein